MKLKSLWIKDYKNLKDFHLDFEKGNGLSILIGNNGSGKSNVLEAISGIFAEFFGKPSDSFKTDYKLNYEINDKNIFLEKKNGKLIYHRDESEMKISDMAPYLPSNVIALYSGEDLRLWENFYFPKYDAYLKNVYRKGYAGKMGMYYVNKYLWNISLLVLLLFMNEFPDVKTFLHDELGIQDESSINLIEIDFSYEHYERNQNTNLKAFIDKINPEGKYVNSYSIAELRQLISNSSNIFEAEPREVFNLLMQAFMPKSFKIISDIHIFLEKGEAIQFFSEGEKKLILIKTVLEFVADENALLLLDEPDANIHEARKSKLYNLLKNTPNREVVMTTHSPTFVEVAEDEELVVLKKNNSNNCYVDDIDKIEQIRYLTGNRINIFSAKPILYCEGALTSIEAELYPILFPEFTVVPSGGHTEVIYYTKMYNKTFSPQNRAVGIIDGDYICQTQKESLEVEHIYSLSILEVENVLMDMILLEAAKEEFCSDSDCIDKVYKQITIDCEIRKESMSIIYAKNHIVSKIVSEISTDGKTIDDFKSNILHLVSMDTVDKIYASQLQRLQELMNINVNELVKIFDFNHNINRFTKPIVDNYQMRIIRLLRRIDSLGVKIRNKYYANVK